MSSKLLLPTEKALSAVANQGWIINNVVRPSRFGNGRFAAELVMAGKAVCYKPFVPMASVSKLASVPDSACITFSSVDDLEKYVQLAAEEGGHSREKVIDLFANFIWGLDGTRACLNNSTWTVNHADTAADGLNIEMVQVKDASGNEAVVSNAIFDIRIDDELHNNYRDFKIPGFYSQYCSDHDFVDVRTAVIRAVDGA